jgi:hypothetical protein
MEVVALRRHRTTGRLIGDAWAEERALLTPISPRVLATLTGEGQPTAVASAVIDFEQHRRGERVQVRDLTEYEVAL